MAKKQSANRASSKKAQGKKPDNSQHVHQNEKINFDLNIREYDWTEKQQAVINASLVDKASMTLVDGIWGSGKAQPLDALVLTPDGFKEMGSLSVGDDAISDEGEPTKIMGIFPQGKIPVYKVSFSDGTSTECCEDHLWATQTHRERNFHKRVGPRKYGKRRKEELPHSIRTTREIKDTLIDSGGRLNHCIPITKPVKFKKRDLLIDPYILGILLGDGCIIHGTVLSTSDQEILSLIEKRLPENMEIKKVESSKYEYRINDVDEKRRNRFTDEIRRLQLNVTSEKKFIPSEYLFSSEIDRLEMVRGLMDSDGTVSRNKRQTSCCVSFTSCSAQLAHQLRFLVESLGGTATINNYKTPYYRDDEGNKIYGKKAYNVYINFNPHLNPFKLKRKADLYIPSTKYKPRRYIVSVDLIGEKECQCILVDNPKHLYLTNNFIVTHNTLVSLYACLQLLQRRKISNILYIRNIVQSGSGTLGWLPGDLSEKTSPWMTPLKQKLDELLPASQADKLIREGYVETQPIALLRGTSYNAYGIIIDEMGCMTKEDILLALSRVGKFSYVFGVGDSWQVDVKDSGFRQIYDIFDDEESKENGIQTFELQDEMDVMRSEFLKFVMKKVKADELKTN